MALANLGDEEVIDYVYYALGVGTAWEKQGRPC
jgi:hypothetical protein